MMNFPNNFKYDVRGGNFERDMEDEYVDDAGGEYVDDAGGEYVDQGGDDGWTGEGGDDSWTGEGGEYVDQGDMGGDMGEYVDQGGDMGEYVDQGGDMGEYVDQGGDQGGDMGGGDSWMGGDTGGDDSWMGGDTGGGDSWTGEGGEYVDQGDMGGDDSWTGEGGEYVDQGDMGGEGVDDQSYVDQAYLDQTGDEYQSGYQEDIFDGPANAPVDGPADAPADGGLTREKLATVIAYVAAAAAQPAGSMPLMGASSGSYTVRYDDGSGTVSVPYNASLGPANLGLAPALAGINGKVYVTLRGSVVVSIKVAPVGKGPPVAPARSQPVVAKGPPVAPVRSQPAKALPVAKGPPVAPPRSAPVVAKGPPIAPARSKPAAPTVAGPTVAGPTVVVSGTVVDGNASGSIKDLNVPAWYAIKYAFGGKDRTYRHNVIVKKPADRLINGARMTLTLDAKTGAVLAVADGDKKLVADRERPAGPRGGGAVEYAPQLEGTIASVQLPGQAGKPGMLKIRGADGKEYSFASAAAGWKKGAVVIMTLDASNKVVKAVKLAPVVGKGPVGAPSTTQPGASVNAPTTIAATGGGKTAATNVRADGPVNSGGVYYNKAVEGTVRAVQVGGGYGKPTQIFITGADKREYKYVVAEGTDVSMWKQGARVAMTTDFKGNVSSARVAETKSAATNVRAAGPVNSGGVYYDKAVEGTIKAVQSGGGYGKPIQIFITGADNREYKYVVAEGTDVSMWKQGARVAMTIDFKGNVGSARVVVPTLLRVERPAIVVPGAGEPVSTPFPLDPSRSVAPMIQRPVIVVPGAGEPVSTPFPLDPSRSIAPMDERPAIVMPPVEPVSVLF